MLLAVAGEYFGYFGVETLLYVPVQVVESAAHLFGEGFSYGSLSYAHVTDEDYAFHGLNL